MTIATTASTPRFWIETGLIVSFATLLGMASAQPRLSGVPSSDDIVKALARPQAAQDAGAPKIRTRGLMLDKSAAPEPAQAAAPAAATAPQATAAAATQAAPARQSSMILAQPQAQKQAPASRAVDLEIQFAFGSDRLTAEGRAVLDQLGAALRSEALADVTGLVLEGHTDAVGSATSNRALSLRRARSAQQYLSQRHGINPTAIQAVGKGSAELADPANPADGINRRVRVIVES